MFQVRIGKGVPDHHVTLLRHISPSFLLRLQGPPPRQPFEVDLGQPGAHPVVLAVDSLKLHDDLARVEELAWLRASRRKR